MSEGATTVGDVDFFGERYGHRRGDVRAIAEEMLTSSVMIITSVV